MTREQEIEMCLRVMLDHVDYTKNCTPNEQVGAVLPLIIIENSQKALARK